MPSSSFRATESPTAAARTRSASQRTPVPASPTLPPRNGMSLEQRTDPDPGPGPVVCIHGTEGTEATSIANMVSGLTARTVLEFAEEGVLMLWHSRCSPTLHVLATSIRRQHRKAHHLHFHSDRLVKQGAGRVGGIGEVRIRFWIRVRFAGLSWKPSKKMECIGMIIINHPVIGINLEGLPVGHHCAIPGYGGPQN
ncbi:hypothetical protein BS47DRAFT_1399288 [Hydnum rufescens UP504]|uniref:Uncharacterized protein n=1 Tax=Hydnum rufescens UP504 TaxID=1448309 RepID=A0A9P6DL67_9AGAM|nr:hypothetical protein BS47DRAFT_1399288 [Hydnum rufescens UP504]